jgi:hypothetical protein
MADAVRVSDVRFSPATATQRETGLRGWARCRLDGKWELDGLGVRRTAQGRYTVTWPTKRDGHGAEHAFFRPITPADWDGIEAAVLAHVRARGFIP